MSLPSQVQTFTFTTYGSNTWSATGKTFTAGKLGVVMCQGPRDTTGQINSVDIGGQTFPRMGSAYIANGYYISFFADIQGSGLTGDASISVTPGGGGSLILCNYSEWDFGATPVEDVAFTTNTGTSAGSGTTPTITPTAGQSVLMLACMTAGSYNPIGPPSGWTDLPFYPGFQPYFFYKTVDPSSGSYDATLTFTYTADWASGIVAFRADSAPAVLFRPYLF